LREKILLLAGQQKVKLLLGRMKGNIYFYPEEETGLVCIAPSAWSHRVEKNKGEGIYA
jgi:hypothetical protein